MTAQRINKQKRKTNRRPPARTNTRGQVERYAGDAYSLATRTWNGLNELRKLVNIEMKYFDTVTTASATQSGGVVNLVALAQGVTENTRVGNSIKVHTMTIKFIADINTATTSHTSVRVLIFRDNENAGTAPTGAQLLEFTGSSTVAYSPLNFDNRKRFAILYDEFITLEPVAGGRNTASRDLSFTLEKHVNYRGTGTAVGDQAEGEICLAAFSGEPTNTPGFTFTSRIIYTDD